MYVRIILFQRLLHSLGLGSQPQLHMCLAGRPTQGLAHTAINVLHSGEPRAWRRRAPQGNNRGRSLAWYLPRPRWPHLPLPTPSPGPPGFPLSRPAHAPPHCLHTRRTVTTRPALYYCESTSR
ncbi:Anthocyanidin 3-O-glucosyltransferase [Frankliniella fusca]|uniref:Anthocyanidin 3-O-glucosyltransferase n=1 Tax=Frankliniella fusca TaxID=407009 RepID=A0AAE1LAP7_9NEOP|nr:Anthocyanidin 3-O-glucosyltransferase [Frankliniella fusca]